MLGDTWPVAFYHLWYFKGLSGFILQLLLLYHHFYKLFLFFYFFISDFEPELCQWIHDKVYKILQSEWLNNILDHGSIFFSLKFYLCISLHFLSKLMVQPFFL